METGILFNTLTVNGTKVYGKVSNDTTEFSFIDEVTVKGNAIYIVDNDKDCGSPIYSKTVDLEIGDNTFYVLEMIGNDVKLFTVTIRRRPMYEVTFNANGGTAVEKQVIEEDFLATEPETTRTGYTFTGWDYDFATPITQTTKITASWSANKDTKYTVNYYLQNLDDNNYILHETVELEGETDTTAYGETERYEHFTYNASKGAISGNINDDGSGLLEVYYTRNTYTLSVNNTSYGAITNSGTYKYGKEITLTASVKLLGYEFVGWYSGEELLSTDTTYTFTVDKDVTAEIAVKEGMRNFSFTSTENTCEITGLIDETVTEVVIPDYVTSIGEDAFEYCDSLTSVVIGDSVTSIGNYAFYNCSRLTSVVIGDSVTSIGSDAFRYCDSLTSVYITDLSAWCKISFGNSSANPLCYAGNLYLNNELVTELVIPDSVTSIGSYAFYNCISLTSVEIPDSVTSIGSYAFAFCDSLTSAVIPDSVTSIASSAFAWCNSLTSVVIPESVTSIGSDAFESCHSLTSVEIPDSVTSIGNYAFYNCSRLTSVVIGDSVTSIGEDAFHDCSSLTSVVIGGSVTSIGSDAFAYCDSLMIVYYKGTASDWAKISIGSDNGDLTIANRYYYSETQPTASGNYWYYNESGNIVIW